MEDEIRYKANNWKKKYRILWAGQGVSIFTSSVIQMALIWYLTEKTSSAAVLTLATFIGFLPQVVLGPFIGVLIDRYNRKRIMILSDSYIALVSASIVIAGFYGEVPVWLIFVVLFLRAIGSAFHNPSLQAVTPSFVPKEELTRYAGYSQGVESVSMLLSPAVAAVLYGILDLSHIILFDIFGALFAMFTLCFVAIPKITSDKEKEKSSVIREAKEGFYIIRKEKGLGSLIVISGLYAVIYFPIGTLFPLICIEYFNGGFVASGIVETIFSIGMLLGAAVLSVIGKKINHMKAISFSIGLYGIGLFISGLLPPEGLPVFIALAFVMGISIPFYRGVKLSVFQTRIQEEYLGRVLTLSNSMQNLSMPVGLLFAGVFAEVIGVEHWFFLSGILTLILSAVSFLLTAKADGLGNNMIKEVQKENEV